ncbi:hypothetical protein J2Z40_003330 [Cytobacillus eiseniae]|uniref:Uncharacterized protein n=1 Tax=Cytobacillus eiseniae TaxID=762947 RepID=A0ABS4RIM7_9BACI|nr:hypothetical protein [Cytobacillus eiseniae]MBP2242750.1 hypothetical protein [Cytobacillus eiseniae]
MIGLILAVLLANFIAFTANKKITLNQMVHIWLFTISFQVIFDVFIDLKYHGYWYISQGIDWEAFPAYVVLIPPVNILFLNWFPFKQKLRKKIFYFIKWEVVLLIYECIAQLPSPYGYFHYGWWKLWHSALINPILLLILLGFYKWIRIIEVK